MSRGEEKGKERGTKEGRIVDPIASYVDTGVAVPVSGSLGMCVPRPDCQIE